jgi:4-amino-4-deoxy-L-arabinose transferase-like glycosyltransferase
MKRLRIAPALHWLLLLTAAVLLRLLVWEMRRFVPLGGDELEYLQAALTLLQERRYVELQFMRPPVYPLFLAASIVLVDSLVQHLRFVQLLISTATVPLTVLLARELARVYLPPQRVATAGFVAGWLAALSYTLAANATELLTETLFLAGLTAALWLLLRQLRAPLFGGWGWLLLGVLIALLTLTRSVGLPLLPLALLWLLLRSPRAALPIALRHAALLLLGSLLLLVPWAARNTLTYGGLILVDTTGAENLWLDNDPAGREAVKAQLYALGDDRLARQQLAAQRGIAVISADPQRFAQKAFGELIRTFALEQSDDLRARPAIVVEPPEVWLRLLLGDAHWLLIALLGAAVLGGLLLHRRPQTVGLLGDRFTWTVGPIWVFAGWAAYILLTTTLFHVELRYRLPLYPILIAPAALLFSGLRLNRWAAAPLPLLVLLLTLLHAPYPLQAVQLAGKHAALALTELQLRLQQPAAALAGSERLVDAFPDSVLARVQQARALAALGRSDAALTVLDQAVALLPAHPYAQLLRADLLRAAGETAAARAALRDYETAARQDLADWLRVRRVSPLPSRLVIADGLELGFISGWHALLPADGDGRRSRGAAWVELQAPPSATVLQLDLAGGRPDGSATALRIVVNGRVLFDAVVPAVRQQLTLPLPADLQGRALLVELRSSAYLPRDFDRSSPDGRKLGVQLFSIEVR